MVGFVPETKGQTKGRPVEEITRVFEHEARTGEAAATATATA